MRGQRYPRAMVLALSAVAAASCRYELRELPADGGGHGNDAVAGSGVGGAGGTMSDGGAGQAAAGAGARGDAAVSGNAGASASAGTSGNAGVSGNAGASASAGASGNAGVSGNAGTGGGAGMTGVGGKGGAGGASMTCMAGDVGCASAQPLKCNTSTHVLESFGAACAEPMPTCALGACTCTGQICGGTCSDVTRDLHHCGSCTRDCAFGSCQGSSCLPQQLATNEVLQGPIATDGAAVYWVTPEPGILRKAVIATGAVSTLDSSTSAGGVAVSGGFVYYTMTDAQSCTLRKLPTDGSSTTATRISSCVTDALQIVVEGARVYFATGDEAIYLASTTGTGGPPTSVGTFTVTMGLGFNSPGHLAVDPGSGVYWTSAENGGEIKKAALDGTGEVVISPATNPDWIAAAGGNVFWIEHRAATNGGDVIRQLGMFNPIATELNAASGLASDGTSVYVGTSGTNPPTEDRIGRVPVGGGSTSFVPSNTDGPPEDMTVDGAAVYWTAEGSVNRLSKSF